MSTGIRRQLRAGPAAAVAVAVAVVAAGFGLAAPAAAAPHASHPAHPAAVTSNVRHWKAAFPAADPTIIVNAGGDRTAATGNPAGLSGVQFRATGANGVTGTCTTGTAGTCSILLTTGVTQVYTIVPVAPPSGWFSNSGLGVSGTPPIPAGTNPQPYATMTTGSVAPGTGVTVTLPAQNATPPNSGNTVRGSQLAFSRSDPMEERTCGQNIALLFDLSSSIVSPVNYLQTYRDAGLAFVNALQGTPSHIAVYTFGTNAPATGNPTLNLESTDNAGSLAALRTKIGGLTVQGSQYTNWDAGLWQVASSGVHYDLVVMLTDGDPTAQGRLNATTPLTLSTTFQKVENGIYSANAVKNAKSGGSLQVVGIGVPSAASHANLRAVSGTGDFISTDFTHLADYLKSVALETCYGLQIKKTAEPAAFSHVGQEITYHYTVTNTGSADLPLHDMTVHDDHINHAINCEPSTLQPGGHALCTATYTTTAEDMDRGYVTNSAYATGVTDTDQTVTSGPDDETVHGPQLELEKSADPDHFTAAGQWITYTYRVTNNGTVPLSQDVVIDDKLGFICEIRELAPGESRTCEFGHLTTQADVEAGSIHNTAFAKGEDEVTGAEVYSPEGSPESEATVSGPPVVPVTG